MSKTETQEAKPEEAKADKAQSGSGWTGSLADFAKSFASKSVGHFILITGIPFLLLGVIKHCPGIDGKLDELSSRVSLVIGVALLCVGLIIIYAKWSIGYKKNMAKLSEEIKKNIQDLQGEFKAASEEIKKSVHDLQTNVDSRFSHFGTEFGELSQKVGDSILNIEDTTRRFLKDFPEIFLCADDMVRACDGQKLWILNFTPYFGAIHSVNKEYAKRYRSLKQSLRGVQTAENQMKTDVDLFRSAIQMKATTVTDFRLATIHAEDFERLFVSPVLRKTPQEVPAEGLESLRNEVIRCHRIAVEAIKEAQPKGVTYLDRIDLQMFICNRVDSLNTAIKPACLVFFIGSDNIGSEKEVRGFYTEFPQLVKMFEKLYDMLVQQNDRSLRS